MKPPNRFAQGTTVPSSKTRGEVETLLTRHGATQYLVAVDNVAGRAFIQFGMAGRIVKLELKILKCTLDLSEAFTKGAPQGWRGWPRARRSEWVQRQNEQHEREAWRRLLLVLKGKLELITDGFSTVEREFLADILLPDGSTVGERLTPQLAESYQNNAMPPLLGAPT